jgi:hypothetical protein
MVSKLFMSYSGTTVPEPGGRPCAEAKAEDPSAEVASLGEFGGVGVEWPGGGVGAATATSTAPLLYSPASSRGAYVGVALSLARNCAG